MRSLSLSSSLLASIAAAGALVGGMMLSPASQAEALAAVQPTKGVTVKGTAIAPDDSPAKKVPVTLSMFAEVSGDSGGGDSGPQMLSAMMQFKTIGKAVTNDEGVFEIKNVKERGQLRLEIGHKLRTPWTITNVAVNKDENVDMGKIKLREKVSR